MWFDTRSGHGPAGPNGTSDPCEAVGSGPGFVLILSSTLGLPAIWLAFPVADALPLAIIALTLRTAKAALDGRNLTTLGTRTWPSMKRRRCARDGNTLHACLTLRNLPAPWPWETGSRVNILARHSLVG